MWRPKGLRYIREWDPFVMIRASFLTRRYAVALPAYAGAGRAGGGGEPAGVAVLESWAYPPTTAYAAWPWRLS